ncbi:MAG: serpin family protein [Kiritimatiellia bacterium]
MKKLILFLMLAVSARADDGSFALNLYQRLAAVEGNVAFSPHSIGTALGMALKGAHGDTAAAMAQTLNAPADASAYDEQMIALRKSLREISANGGPRMQISNRMWPQQGYYIREAYEDSLQRVFDADTQTVDYRADAEAARQTINRWVALATANRIKELLPQGILNTLTRVVLTNTIWFKGKWALAFKAEETREADFYSGPAPVKVPMMKQTGDFLYVDAASFQALEMPYIGDRVAMLILLPRARDGISALEQKLDEALLKQCIDNLKKTKVDVGIPRFTAQQNASLKDVLTAMGMGLAFSGDADFSGITGERELYISDVMHSAMVEVNEEGTEAAAATAVVMAKTAFQRTPVFRADHPFIYIIRDRQTGAILFMGRFAKPS